MPPPLCLPARPPSAFIASRHPSAWRETLAALLTGAPYDQFTPLLGVLAGKLAAAGMAHAATLVYVCAGDVDAAVRQWTRAAVKEGQGQAAAAGGPSVEALEVRCRGGGGCLRLGGGQGRLAACGYAWLRS